MIEAIFAHGGTLVGYRGDGLLVVFGAPLAFDDRADRALTADGRCSTFAGRDSTSSARRQEHRALSGWGSA